MQARDNRLPLQHCYQYRPETTGFLFCTATNTGQRQPASSSALQQYGPESTGFLFCTARNTGQRHQASYSALLEIQTNDDRLSLLHC